MLYNKIVTHKIMKTISSTGVIELPSHPNLKGGQYDHMLDSRKKDGCCMTDMTGQTILFSQLTEPDGQMVLLCALPYEK